MTAKKDGRALPTVSIIIPVWNDAKGLAQCLAGFASQSYPSDRLQVIVVDNGSSDRSAEIAGSIPGVRVLREPKPGSYAARNTGLREARGTYIAFIDSDCVPDRRWIESAVAMAREVQDLGVVAGHVDITFADNASRAASILYEQMFSFNQKSNVQHGTCITANWLSPKSVLDRFGGFDDALKAGGDTQLSRRISEAGLSTVYCEDMVVYHPARATIGSLLAKRRRVVGGKWATTLPSGAKIIRLTALFTWDAVLRSLQAWKARDLPKIDRLRVIGIIAAIWAVGLAELPRLIFGFAPRR